MSLFDDVPAGPEILEVEMACQRSLGELAIFVTSLGPYQGFKVNCSRAARIEGARYRGRVYGTHKIDANQQHCVLVGPNGKRDVHALERL